MESADWLCLQFGRLVLVSLIFCFLLFFLIGFARWIGRRWVDGYDIFRQWLRTRTSP